MKYAGVMDAWKDYAPRDNKYVEAKIKLVNNVENFYKGREKIMEGFKNEVFPFYYDKQYEEQMKIDSEEEEGKKKQDRKPFDPDEVIEWMINKEEARINNEIFKKHFEVETPSVIYNVLYETKDKEKK